MTNKVLELFGHSVRDSDELDWDKIVTEQICSFTGRRCFKVRKSQPDLSIGTCTVRYGRAESLIAICPNRLLERRQVFADAIHLLTAHQPGNEFHVIPEVSIPGGSVDYFLASVRKNRVRDFVGIEFQTLDTTGTVWPERQRLMQELGLPGEHDGADDTKSFGMNWKMTAKTILVQMHHKVETFEHIGKHIVLVVQDHLMNYMRGEFNFDHLSEPARVDEPLHFHSYEMSLRDKDLQLELANRSSTDSDGMATCLGLQAEARVELEEVIRNIERKVSIATRVELA